MKSISEPLTIEELQSLGFVILTKKRRGEVVFNQCFLDCSHHSYEFTEIVGTFHSPPSLKQILEQSIGNAKQSAEFNLREKFSKKALALLED